jgi:hypothetical protein
MLRATRGRAVVSGDTTLQSVLPAKRLELLNAMLPGVSNVAVSHWALSFKSSYGDEYGWC